MSDEVTAPTHWKCHYHNVVGVFDDGSLKKHEDTEHGGQNICVEMLFMVEHGHIVE